MRPGFIPCASSPWVLSSLLRLQTPRRPFPAAPLPALERLEPRDLPTGLPFISEIMASNHSGQTDDAGRHPDWIEIHNPTDAPLSLAGWHLSDSPARPDRWIFPADAAIAPGGYLLLLASGENRLDASGLHHLPFKLDAQGETLILSNPDLSPIHQLIFPAQRPDLSFGADSPYHTPAILAHPTPGQPNAPAHTALPPIIHALTDAPIAPPNQPILITAAIEPAQSPIATVILSFRTMYGTLVHLPMRDDGTGGDAAAFDGLYTATLPAPMARAGQMIRWYAVATDTAGRAARMPAFAAPDEPEYFGTVIIDPASVGSALPVFQWFTANPSAAKTRQGTRASLLYDGRFYDNVLVHLRGGTTASMPNPSLEFEFPSSLPFHFLSDQEPVRSFNLNTNYSDKAYLRQALSFELFRLAGLPAPQAFLMTTYQNGRFHSLRTAIQRIDRPFLHAHGMDPDGPLYKMYDDAIDQTPGDAVSKAEKKTREFEDASDLQQLIDAIAPSNPARFDWAAANIDLSGLINYMAVNTLLGDRDHGKKNYYLHRDLSGDGRWRILPWDKDLTFGRNWNGGLLKDDLTATNPPDDVNWNALLALVYQSPQLEELYLRRLRTLMDQFLLPPGQGEGESWLDQRMMQMVQAAAPAAALDYALWAGAGGWSWGDASLDMTQAVQQIRDLYLAPRRRFLYDLHATDLPGAIGIPPAQPAAPRIEIHRIITSGEAAFIDLLNLESTPIDLSGWHLQGAAALALPSGFIIPASGTVSLLSAARPPADDSSSSPPALWTGPWIGDIQSTGALTLLDAQLNRIDHLPFRGDDPLADFNQSGRLDAPDLDILLRALHAAAGSASPPSDARLDLTGDQRLDDQDLRYLLANLMRTTRGDINLSGQTDIDDLLILSENFSSDNPSGHASADPANHTALPGWSRGDLNGDGRVTIGDLAILAEAFNTQPQAIPQPLIAGPPPLLPISEEENPTDPHAPAPIADLLAEMGL